MPVPGPVDRVDDIQVPLDSLDCPRCGASLEVVEQTAAEEDTLPQPVRSIQRFRVEHGRCHVCGWTGRGRHVSLAAGQHGAIAHRTGPNVMAQALTLHYHYGLPLSKVPAAIAAATGIRVTQSALTQAAAGLAAEGGVVHTAYQELRAAVPASAVVNTDDTGWRIGGTGAFLMGFFTPLLAVFQIRRQLAKQLRDRRLKDTDHQRLLDGIGRQHDRGRVLLFLEHPEIEPTNNRAERGLRGAVIARKVSHCSKNERGAQTYEAMKSVTATLALRGHSVARVLADFIKGRPMPAAVAR